MKIGQARLDFQLKLFSRLLDGQIFIGIGIRARALDHQRGKLSICHHSAFIEVPHAAASNAAAVRPAGIAGKAAGGSAGIQRSGNKIVCHVC